MASKVANPLVTHIAGQASKRGLIPRMPAGERLLADAETWLRAEYPEAVRASRRRTLPTGEAELRVALHPAVPEVVLTASDTGRVFVAAETVAAGPGYHRFVGRVLERLGLNLSISWSASGRGDLAARGADIGMAFFERPAADRFYLGWLGQALGHARAGRQRGDTGIHLGTPVGTRFTFDGAIATVLGPRDDAWLDAAVADTRIAIEITPWWADATDGRYLLNRALCLMWLEVRWRAPAIEEEAIVLDEVHRLLSRAYLLEPDLPYPWLPWTELTRLRGIDDPMARQAAARAASEPATGTPTGYRREPVMIIHEGWALEIPGSFAERRTDEEWWGGGLGRGISLAATATATADGPMSAQAFIDQVASSLGPDTLSHRAGLVVGRARLGTDASTGLEVGVLDGYSAVQGSGATVRITFDDQADWQWAIDTWRALAPG